MQRYDGEIAGIGTAQGTRIVLGMWRSTPFGAIADAMIERPDGHRVLIAPSEQVGRLLADTYCFDEVRVEDVGLFVDGSTRTFVSDTVRVHIETGGRTVVGQLLSLVPDRLARSRTWCRLVNPVARLIRRGVRTVGTAGNGRREYYCAADEHALSAAGAEFDGADLGALRPVTPAVRFGFASTPSRPTIVEVTTWIDAEAAVDDRPSGETRTGNDAGSW